MSHLAHNAAHSALPCSHSTSSAITPCRASGTADHVQSLDDLLLFWRFWANSSCPDALVSFPSTAPAHPHATRQLDDKRTTLESNLFYLFKESVRIEIWTKNNHFWGFWAFWAYSTCPDDPVTFSSTAPAHPHATRVAMHPALLKFIPSLELYRIIALLVTKICSFF